MNQKYRENDYIDLTDIWNAVIRHAGKIVLVSILCGMFGFIYSFFLATPLYSASAMMIVNAGKNSEYVTQDQLNSATKLVEIYSVIITSDTVMDKVKTNLNIKNTYESMVKDIKVTSVNETQVMEIEVIATEPELALKVCKEITNVAPNIIIKTVKAGSVELVSKASTTGKQVSPNIKRMTIFGILFGFVMSATIVVLITLTDNKIKGEKDIKQSDIALLGVIPSYEMEGE